MRTAVQSAKAAAAPAPAPGPAESPLEAYFLRVIESQPVCLTRIASDGTFLAVNDAAMSLLGVERLDQILDTSLLNLVAPHDRDQCRAFLGRITGGDRGSTEVELTGLAGLQHTLQIHAVAIAGSPDSAPAAFCTFRDITEHRRLERALLDAAAREEQQSSALAGERERLNAALVESRDAATRASVTAAEQARIAPRAAALADAESRHRELEEQHSARQSQLIADFETAQQQFEAALAEQLSKLSEAEAARAGAEARERALSERVSAGEQQSTTALAQATAEHGIQAAALRDSIKTLEASLAEATAREGALAAARQAEEAKWKAETDALKQAFEELQQVAKGVEQDRDEVIARYDTDRVDWERRAADAAHAAQAQVAAEVQAAKDEAAATLQAVQAQAAALEAARAQADAELQSARAEAEAAIGALREEIQSLEAIQAGLVQERDALQRAVADGEVARGAIAAKLASAGAERIALEAEVRALERNARGGRFALALAADLEATLAAGTDSGRRVLGTLADADPVRGSAEQWLASTLEAAGLVRRLRRDTPSSLSAALVSRVVRTLEPALGALLSPDIALSVLVGSDLAHVDLSADQLEQLLLTLVVHRRTMLQGSGQMSLEVADVELDDECGREHGASPGPYVLIALHVAGGGVETRMPAEIFGVPGTLDTWRAAGPGLASVLQLAHAAGGHAWVTKEGPEAVAFEVYLPRVEPDPDEVKA
jgi:PAS domain S-box-containing protein